jgi:flagellar motor switch protein FliN/FliY
MAMTQTNDALSRALARELSRALAARFGGVASMDAGEQVGGPGWMVAVPVTGTAQGRLLVWFDAASALACVQRAAPDAINPADDAIATTLEAVMARAVDEMAAGPEAAGLQCGVPSARQAAAPAHAGPYAVVLEDGLTFGFSIAVELASAQDALPAAHDINDSRLAAVLEVDLPLVVRFGRAVMPLRAVAELSPGAVVDMGRSPDEPVELLVGDRLIARGEVVIVGGNYGVRITELTSGRRSTDLEARV